MNAALSDSAAPSASRAVDSMWRWAALGSGVLLLFVFQPYAAGYGDLRKSLFTICTDAWFNPQDSTWQHGALVPFVVGWLVWQRRRELASIIPEGRLLGAAGSALSLTIYYVGFKAHNYYLGAAALMMLIPSGVLWLFGWKMLMGLLFPLAMLVFLWPLRFLEDTLGFELRFLMVRLVGLILDLFGAPIVRDGTTLISAATESQAAGHWLRLNIEGPCSGMRSLFALMMVSALFAWHRTRSAWQRALLCALSIPFAVLGNMVRIFMLIIGSALFGQSFAVGDEEVETSSFHFLSGIAVFVVAVLALEGTAALMKRWSVRWKT